MFLVLAAIVLTVRMPHAPSRAARACRRARPRGLRTLMGHRAHGAAVRARVRAVLRLLRTVRVGTERVRRRGRRDLAVHAGHRARRQHGDDRGRAVRRPEVRGAPRAVAGDRRRRRHLGRRLDRRRDSRGLGHGSQAMATAAFISTYALFGLGESMLSPTVAPLVADLAPAGWWGQYNSRVRAGQAAPRWPSGAGRGRADGCRAARGGRTSVTFLLFSLGITFLALRLGEAAHSGAGPAVAGRQRVVMQSSRSPPPRRRESGEVTRTGGRCLRVPATRAFSGSPSPASR